MTEPVEKIIDAGALRSTELSRFLEASKENRAVLCDYVGMEAFQGDATVNIRKSLRILAQHPNQVLILKPTTLITALRPRSKGLRRRLIDFEQTAAFAHYCDTVLSGRANADVLSKGSRANARRVALTESAEVMRKAMTTLFETYPEEVLRCLRSGTSIPESLAHRVVRDILMITALLFRSGPTAGELPNASDVISSIQFRYALCSYVLVMRWAGKSGHANASADRLRNDFIDTTYAAYATFFDGLITKDKRLAEVYSDIVRVLGTAFRRSA